MFLNLTLGSENSEGFFWEKQITFFAESETEACQFFLSMTVSTFSPNKVMLEVAYT